MSKRGKHVQTTAQDSRPRDLSAKLAEHRARADAGATTPATTPAAGSPPGLRSRDNSGEPYTSATESTAWSTGNTWHPRASAGEYAGY